MCKDTKLLDSRGADQLRVRYDENVRRADENVRELVSGLRAMGFGSETALVILADHGEEFDEHGWVGHGGAPYCTQSRVPLLVSTLGPSGLGQGTARDDLAATIDIAPTICGLLGVAPPPHAMGRNLLGSACDAAAPRYTLGLRRLGVESFTFGSARLLVNTAGADYQLFDVDRDPGEEHDLAPVFPVRADALRARAMLWKQRIAGGFVPPEAPAVQAEEEPDATAPDASSLQKELGALGYL